MMKTILTYGTFDLFHVGHLNILERLSAMGDRLIVGVSTDEFNELKGKESIFSYSERVRIVGALSCVDGVIPEESWDQKESDIKNYNVTMLGMGDDWHGKFDYLLTLCEVFYLPRTVSVSTTKLRSEISKIDQSKLKELRDGLNSLLQVAKALG
jgi:glycerol-3-phosphate cytidylyltransferase